MTISVEELLPLPLSY